MRAAEVTERERECILVLAMQNAREGRRPGGCITHILSRNVDVKQSAVSWLDSCHGAWARMASLHSGKNVAEFSVFVISSTNMVRSAPGPR